MTTMERENILPTRNIMDLLNELIAIIARQGNVRLKACLARCCHRLYNVYKLKLYSNIEIYKHDDNRSNQAKKFT